MGEMYFDEWAGYKPIVCNASTDISHFAVEDCKVAVRALLVL